ncbi:MAG: hypothetical protein J6S14_12820 [Clostridia bacterium]|nr:hypothetical protein [Clostridia bacterium]
MEKINVKVGNLFKIGEQEFICFGKYQGGIAAVSKEFLFSSRYGADNNFAKSIILEKLQKEYLPKIEREIGAENVLEFETDLISLDGSRKHGILKSKVSLPTFDFYRTNRSIFEKYKLDEWTWLATPWETSEYTDDDWIVCVSPRGDVNVARYYGDGCVVRPFLILKSDIFEF